METWLDKIAKQSHFVKPIHHRVITTPNLLDTNTSGSILRRYWGPRGGTRLAAETGMTAHAAGAAVARAWLRMRVGAPWEPRARAAQRNDEPHGLRKRTKSPAEQVSTAGIAAVARVFDATVLGRGGAADGACSPRDKHAVRTPPCVLQPRTTPTRCARSSHRSLVKRRGARPGRLRADRCGAGRGGPGRPRAVSTSVAENTVLKDLKRNDT